MNKHDFTCNRSDFGKVNFHTKHVLYHKDLKMEIGILRSFKGPTLTKTNLEANLSCLALHAVTFF